MIPHIYNYKEEDLRVDYELKQLQSNESGT